MVPIMSNIEQLKSRLSEAVELPSAIDRRMTTLAVVTQALLDRGVMAVLVGGGAVEFYTAGGYTTTDLDVITPSVSDVESTMTELGFTKSGRHWQREELDVFIEMPTPPLDGSADKVVEVDMGDLRVFVIGVEDLIFDRLKAYEYWKSKDDGRWARRLMTLQQDTIDWEYLERRVADEGLQDAYTGLKEASNGA